MSAVELDTADQRFQVVLRLLSRVAGRRGAIEGGHEGEPNSLHVLQAATRSARSVSYPGTRGVDEAPQPRRVREGVLVVQAGHGAGVGDCSAALVVGGRAVFSSCDVVISFNIEPLIYRFFTAANSSGRSCSWVVIERVALAMNEKHANLRGLDAGQPVVVHRLLRLVVHGPAGAPSARPEASDAATHGSPWLALLHHPHPAARVLLGEPIREWHLSTKATVWEEGDVILQCVALIRFHVFGAFFRHIVRRAHKFRTVLRLREALFAEHTAHLDPLPHRRNLFLLLTIEQSNLAMTRFDIGLSKHERQGGFCFVPLLRPRTKSRAAQGLGRELLRCAIVTSASTATATATTSTATGDQSSL